MPQMINPLSIGIPAFNGLNLELQNSILGPEWATELDNFVFDSAGRIAARNGWREGSFLNGYVRALWEEYNGTIIAAAGGKLYADYVDVTGSVVATDDYWQFVNFYDKVLGFQTNHSPISRSGGNFATLAAVHGGDMPTTWGGVALAAYGRIWASDATGQVVKYSALYDETNYNASGTLDDNKAGFIDLTSVWKNGYDTIQYLAAFNGQLIVFGKRSILVWSSPMLPYTEMSLVDNVADIGCIARDSVQTIGEDIWFLSSSGLRSLSRTVIKDKMPLSDISRNVRSRLISTTINVQEPLSIKSTYSEKHGFYLLSIPQSSLVFVFDIRAPLEDGSYRCSTWSNTIPLALLNTRTGELYAGTVGTILNYNNVKQDPYSSSYDVSYKSGWLDMQAPSQYKIMKQLKAVVYTGSTNTVTFDWQFDFSSTGYTVNKTITGANGSLWGVALWGSGTYSGGGQLVNLKVPLKGYGNLFRLTLGATINGFDLAIHKIDVFVKPGRIN